MKEPQTGKVGRYELLAKVGQGAMGIVYRAQDPTIRRIVALKVVPVDTGEPEGTSGSRGRSHGSSFDREAQAAGALLHPNIVTLYDAGRDGDWYYLAMEFIEGETFAAEIAREGRVRIERAAEVAADVADALDVAHERGVIHRDIKPANLMILPDRSVKVADFGIARLANASATMTTDMVVGTPYYMSPEQVRGGKLDGRSDLFSLGVVLYEAITGRRPFQADALATILNNILNTTPPAPHEVEPDIPRELSSIVMRAMGRTPEERYARGKELAGDLRGFLGATSAAAPGGNRPRSWRAMGAGALLALVAAIVLIVAGGAFKLSPVAKPAAVGYLEFVSEPSGAEIFLDGAVVGRTPYTAEVSAGQHEVEFRKDGYYPAAQSPSVEPNKRVVIELPMLARKEG